MGCFYIRDDDASTNNLTKNTTITTTLILSSLESTNPLPKRLSSSNIAPIVQLLQFIDVIVRHLSASIYCANTEVYYYYYLFLKSRQNEILFTQLYILWKIFQQQLILHLPLVEKQIARCTKMMMMMKMTLMIKKIMMFYSLLSSRNAPRLQWFPKT